MGGQCCQTCVSKCGAGGRHSDDHPVQKVRAQVSKDGMKNGYLDSCVPL